MQLYKLGTIERITGPVVVARDMLGAQMYELVKVAEAGLIGEIIRVEGERATVQVYEETVGIKPGEKVERTGKPLSVELGPGMINQIYDGIQRPLPTLREIAGTFITRGVTSPALDRKKTWQFVPRVKSGQKVLGGDVLGEVQGHQFVGNLLGRRGTLVLETQLKRNSGHDLLTAGALLLNIDDIDAHVLLDIRDE